MTSYSHESEPRRSDLSSGNPSTEVPADSSVEMPPSGTEDVAAVPSAATAPPPAKKKQTGLTVVALALLTIAGGLFWLRWDDVLAVAGVESGQRSTAVEDSPFDLDDPLIPREKILSGNVVKDGIPSLSNPGFVAGDAADFLEADDRVIGVVAGDVARAYPLQILDFHEVVNDRFGTKFVAVTYCPLCDSAAVFDTTTQDGSRNFGVSGLLYNSNVLMYDRATESLWSQMSSGSVTGEQKGQAIRHHPFEVTTWEDWLARHPGTDVLSTKTGHERPYGRSPYQQYFAMPSTMFPVEPQDGRLPLKARVLGLWTAEAAVAVPLQQFQEAEVPAELTVSVGNRSARLLYNPQARSLRVLSADEGVSWVYAFWFAWYAFHPETELHAPEAAGSAPPESPDPAE